MSKQLSQEELQQLKGIKDEVIALASALGELEYQRILVEAEHKKLEEAVLAVKVKEQGILKSFGEKYGDGVINLETGEIDPRQ